MVDNETPSFMDTMIINKVGPSRESAEKYEGIAYQSNDHIENYNKQGEDLLFLPSNNHASNGSTGKKVVDSANLRIG